MQVEGQQVGCLHLTLATGARVRNACRTCPAHWDSPLKGGLILDGSYWLHDW